MLPRVTSSSERFKKNANEKIVIIYEDSKRTHTLVVNTLTPRDWL